MQHQQELEQRLFEMEQVAQAFQVSPFDVFLMGGSACLLAGYTSRATRDFDLLDLDYSASLAKVLVLLRDYDLLEYNSTLIAPSYRERCKKLSQFTHLNIFVLSAEDIIVSKLIPLNERDLEDLDTMMPQADYDLLLRIIDEVLMRDDLYEPKKKGLRKNLNILRSGTMYRILSESVQHYMRDPATQGTRRKAMGPIFLLVNPETYHREHMTNTELFQETQELLNYLQQTGPMNPRFQTFLWRLESREITPPAHIQLNDKSLESCREQARILQQLISLAYWN